VKVLDVAAVPAELRAARGAALARIEDAGLTASQPREQAFYDGWLLRYANGKAKRARSVNPISAGDLPLDAKLAYCADFYARHDVPFMLRLTPFSQPRDLDDALACRGYTAAEDTRVMVAAVGERPPLAVPGIAPTTLGRAEFGAVFADLHRLDPARAAVERDRFARCAGEGVYLVVRDGEGTVACGSALFDGALVGVFGMVTAESHRGRGLATRIVAELLQRARARGCTTAYLQVEAGNAPARRAYGKFGFRDRYAYWYRTPPREGRT
jgi:GNAT superfamily N-acetyltransferase